MEQCGDNAKKAGQESQTLVFCRKSAKSLLANELKGPEPNGHSSCSGLHFSLLKQVWETTGRTWGQAGLYHKGSPLFGASVASSCPGRRGKTIWHLPKLLAVVTLPLR